MADRSKIEWTDATWNPITGCSVVSPGCTNCYAMRLAGTRMRNHPSRKWLTKDSKAGPVWTGEVRLNEEWLLQPLLWKRPRRIFVCAHGDLFHESVPDDWIDRVFAIMALAPQHTFQVLTKRSKRMRDYIGMRGGDWQIVLSESCPPGSLPITKADVYRHLGLSGKFDYDPPTPAWPLPNVHLGISAEDQRRWDERWPNLQVTPAVARIVSAEPLLSDIKMRGAKPDWVIVGGESGPNARPMNPDWARSLRDQCAAAGIPFMFKQWGEWLPRSHLNPTGMANSAASAVAWKSDVHRFYLPTEQYVFRVGKRRAGRLLDGVEHNEMPEVRR